MAKIIDGKKISAEIKEELKTGDSSERETADRTTNYTGEQGADRP